MPGGCSTPQLNTEGHPVGAPTPIYVQVHTLHRMRPFSITPPCRQPHSDFRGFVSVSGEGGLLCKCKISAGHSKAKSLFCFFCLFLLPVGQNPFGEELHSSYILNVLPGFVG